LQPQAGLRFATVAVKTDNYYIVAAQSLLEKEKLIGTVGILILASWLACTCFSVIVLGIAMLIIRKFSRINKS